MIQLFSAGLLLAFVIFFLPKGKKFSLALLSHVMVVVGTSVWAVEALFGNAPIEFELGVSSWNGPLLVSIDPMSAYFILIVNFICLAGFIYAGGYLRPYLQRKRAAVLSLHLFSLVWLHGSMVLVACFQDGIGFLLAWELMSLFSFVLVIFDAEKETTLMTGINYLLQMHLGFALIMFGFLVTANTTGGMSFSDVGTYFATHSNVGLFLLFFAGFGIKAGFMPLHTWLPRAHPAAPSHVSGIMSGVMIKMGIYGIFRIASHLQQNYLEIGMIVLFISLITGVMGVVMAIVQHDLKKLLAYHSIENIGIIGIGLGVALLGKAYNEPILMLSGLMGSILHTLNHALFKSLLFFSAGNVNSATGTVNMDRLGGLARTMRGTSFAFLIGALAISGIPPFNGFISEYLIYSGVTYGQSHAGFSLPILGLITVLALVVIGGLCLYCFTKAFGMTFLGTRREALPKPQVPVTSSMLVPAILIVPVIVGIGIFPSYVVQVIFHVTKTFSYLDPGPEAISSILPALRMVGWVNVVVIAAIVLLALLRKYFQQKVSTSFGPTWGCGYSAGDFRHQYTPTSYASSLRELASPLLATKDRYRPMAEAEIFPEKRGFETSTQDLIEERGILNVVNFIVNLLPKLAQAQTGIISHYLIYPLLFLMLFGLLSYLNVL